MKIACIYTVVTAAGREKPLSSLTEIPFGMATIVTVLKHAGHRVSLFVFSPRSRWREKLAGWLLGGEKAMICISAVSTQAGFVGDIASWIKERNCGSFVLLGGHHGSLDPEGALSVAAFDALCVGEGENAVLETANKLDKGEPVEGVAGIWTRAGSGKLVKGSPVPFREDLDSLPPIDRSVWEEWTAELRFPSMLLGRGCPYRCTYCSNHRMRTLSEGRYVRFRSAESIVSELGEICERYPEASSVYLEVETITAWPGGPSALFRELSAFNRLRDRPVSFGVNMTVTSSLAGDEPACRNLVERMREAGVAYLNLGLESGSERLRKEVLNRPACGNRDFLNFSRMAADTGMKVFWYVLVGLPGETVEDFRETVRMCREGRPDQVHLSIFYPYPGTNLYELAKEGGFIPAAGPGRTAERGRAVLDMPGFRRRRIRREYILFWFRAFRGVWPTDRILMSTLRSILSAYPRLYSLAKYLSTHNPLFRRMRDRYAPRSGSPSS